MTLDLRPATERGHAQFGWLDSRHSFSFGSYFDPQHTGFSDLLVINDDRVAPGRGFDRHSHADMEIFSYVLDGALEHRDSMGTGSVIRPGDVQLMSAGTGVSHSEYNHSAEDGVHFLQIWIVPAKRGLSPRYQQQHFAPDTRRGRLRLILSPHGEDGALAINQDARVWAGLFDGDEHAELTLPADRHAYVHVARGHIVLNGTRLSQGDGVKLRHATTLSLAHGEDAEVLVFDLRPKELPTRPQ